MPYPLFQFQQPGRQQDQSAQAGLQQYMQQGQAMIDPGQAQVAASNPIAAAGTQGLARAFQQSQQNGPPATQQPQMNAAGLGYDPNPAGPGLGSLLMNNISPQPGFDQYAGQQSAGGPSLQQLLLAQGLVS